MKDLILLVIASLVLWIVVGVSDMAWGGELPSFDKEIPANLIPSSWDIQQALDQLDEDKSFYDTMVELFHTYTNVEFNITPTTRLEWHLNKIDAQYKFDHGGKAFFEAQATFNDLHTKVGYTIDF